MTDARLAGHVALITGANNPEGIGAAIARALAADGASVYLHGYRPPASSPRQEDRGVPGAARYAYLSSVALDIVLKQIRQAGARAEGQEIDLAGTDAPRRLFDAAESTLGPVSILINNAASSLADTFLPGSAALVNDLVEAWSGRPPQITGDTFDRNFLVNARAAGLLMAEFATRHRARGAGWGRIVNISTAGARAFPSEVSYGASKLALEGMTRSAAIELGQFGITVNAIAPGPVQTGWITPELEERLLPTIPLGRLGKPEDIADVVAFLVSNRSRWVTGQCFFVGGGHGM